MTTITSFRTHRGLTLLMMALMCNFVLTEAGVDLPTRASSCGVQHLNHYYYQRINNKDKLNLEKIAPLLRRQAVTQIPVHWHLMKYDNTEVNGNIPLSRILQVMDSLNTHHNPAGFNFFMGSIEWIDVSGSPDFFYLAPYTKPQFIQQISSKYRKGNKRHINFYVADLTTDNVGGMTTYPWSTTGSQYSQDWSLIDTWAVMEHPDYPADYGATMELTVAHEAGHWLGLFHTFENGCAEPGDYVDDTNPEATANGAGASCSAADVCAGLPAPIDNLMDYGTCRNSFTAGQNQRMSEQFLLYRNYDIDYSVVTYGQNSAQITPSSSQQVSSQQTPATSNGADQPITSSTNALTSRTQVTSQTQTSEQAQTMDQVHTSDVVQSSDQQNQNPSSSPVQTSQQGGPTQQPIRPGTSSNASATPTSSNQKTFTVTVSDPSGGTYIISKPDARDDQSSIDEARSSDGVVLTGCIAVAILAFVF